MTRTVFIPVILSLTVIPRLPCLGAAPPTPIPVSVPTRKEPVSYAKDVVEVLSAKCVSCHSDVLAENQLNMEEVAGMLKGGKGGPAIVPGKADESLLFKMASHRVRPVMPPEKKKDAKALSPDELGLLKLWIDAGARDDSEENARPVTPVVLGEIPPGVHPINSVDMTGDGARVAFGRANVVQVHDTASGLEILSLGGHRDLIQSLRFSPDGRKLAAGSYQLVTVWSVPTGGLKATLSGHGDQVKAVALLPDGATIVSAGLDQTVRFWDRQGKALRQFSVPTQILSLAVAPSGDRLAVGGADQTVRLHNTADGKELHVLKGHSGPVNDVAFLGSGERMVSVSEDGTGRIWSFPVKVEKANEPVVIAGDDGPLRALAILAGGKRFVTAGKSGKIRVWNGEDGRVLKTLPDGPGGAILALAIRPGGDQLLAGAEDRTARVFNLSDGRTEAVLGGHAGPVNSVAFSPDGRRMVTAGGEGGIKVWDTTDGRGVIAFGHILPDQTVPQAVQDVVFADNGTLVSASADKTLKTWSFEGSWSELRALGPHSSRVLALDFNPDGTLLAAGGGEPSRSGEIRIWEVGKGLPVRTLDGLHSDTVLGLRFSPDGSRLASVGADKFLKVIRVADGKELRSFEGHTHHVLSVDWKSDGKQIVTGGADNVVKLWDVESGDQVRTFNAAGKQVTAVRWLSGKPDVAGASGDKLVRFWNADNGNVSRTFNGPADYLQGLATSSDGGRIAAGGADGVLFLWNGQNAQLQRKIEPASRPATK
ncbi:MAG: hypothetical protein NVSMB9_14940 [Isosphaeraceae bacterium]